MNVRKAADINLKRRVCFFVFLKRDSARSVGDEFEEDEGSKIFFPLICFLRKSQPGKTSHTISFFSHFSQYSKKIVQTKDNPKLLGKQMTF